MPAKIDKEKCEGCEDCIPVCPTDSIKMEEKKANVDEESCIDCNACTDVCIHGAIEIK